MNHTGFTLGIVKIRPLLIRPHDLARLPGARAPRWQKSALRSIQRRRLLATRNIADAPPSSVAPDIFRARKIWSFAIGIGPNAH